MLYRTIEVKKNNSKVRIMSNYNKQVFKYYIRIPFIDLHNVTAPSTLPTTLSG